MQTSNIVWGICGGLAVALSAVATVIWAVWISRYVERHGERSAAFIFTFAAVKDYRTARSIAKNSGRTPWFVTWFGRLMVAALTFLLAALLISVLY
jgi:hypothetical protein